MKKIFSISCIVFIASCSTKKDLNITLLAENYLKNEMKDPSSFQVIKSNIVDTIMMSAWLKEHYKMDTAMIAKTIRENKIDIDLQFFEKSEEKEKEDYQKVLNEKVNIYRQNSISELSELQALKTDSIFYITVNINYRAKNSFGALDVDSKAINFYPADSTFKIKDD